ncbi:PAS domain-containing protein [Larkinella bovis]|uniref:histidine kinase n=1 Tax=Larkinella bovis TaxID=683041 RepID=A0ABW0IHK2_9BACT
MATPDRPENTSTELIFTHLPGFAKFLLERHLEEFSAELLRLYGEVDIPMLAFFKAWTPEQLRQLSYDSSAKLLTAFAENRISGHIDATLQRWAQDQLQGLNRTQIAPKDISLMGYVRKQAMLTFLPGYTADVAGIIDLVREIDAYVLDLASRATGLYINILHGKIDEQFYFHSKLTDTMPGVIYVFDLIERKERYTSQRVEPMLGYTPDEIRAMGSMYLETVHHPTDIPRILAHLESFSQVKDGEVQTFEHRLKDKSGHYRWLRNYESVFRRKPDGQPWEIIGLTLDIDLEKQSLQLVEEKQKFIQKITDAAPAIIATFNVNTGQYLFVSQGFELLLGYSPQRLQAEGIGFLIGIMHPDDFPKLMEENLRSLEKANQASGNNDEVLVSEFTYRMRHHNGQYRWFQTYGTVFDRDREGKVEHILNISLDITDKVEAENQAGEKNRRLEQSNASLQEFAYIASHDLKEPLRKITAFGDRLLLSQRDKMDAEGQLFLTKIIDAAQRMHNLIGDVLSVSLISSDQRFEKQDLKLLLDDVVQSLDFKIEQVKAEIYADDLPAVAVVASQFRQLFLNLLTNAFKFARHDVPPVVRITYRFLQPGDVWYSGLTPARRYLELKIADNGIGFDNRYAGKIFAIFQRLHAKKEFEGTGIGLAICKKIVENHGGIITANGVPNQGATFTVIIPAG